MNKASVLARIREVGILPAFRLPSADDALFAVQAVAESGIGVAEVTMTIPGALEVLHTLRGKLPDLVLGAGTVLNVETAKKCLDAGAMFLTSPGLDAHVVEFAVERNVAVLPGALTPSEVMAARKVGSDFVKIYPCSQLGGASYIKSLRAPFPDVQLIAAGGVNHLNATEFLLAGAVAIGVGRELISPEAVRRRQVDWIRELSHRFLQIIKDTRLRLNG